ncbi:MAG: holo-ACP synthase [Candidatus Methylomirabilales bacterium]
MLPVRLPALRRLPLPAGGGRRRPGPRIGVDLIAVAKVRRVFQDRPALQAQVFTAGELAYATGQRRPFLHLAARFAAKEAVLKGLGTGLAGGMTWQDVETVRGLRGEPRLRLSGETARLARRAGFRRYAVSLSHSEEYALAAVLLAP